jgi:hypothetical protein
MTIMSSKLAERRAGLALASAALVAFVGGVGHAAIPQADGNIAGCYSNRTGRLRVIDTEAGQACTAREKPVTVAGPGSTSFYLNGGKVADSNLLDGMEPDELAPILSAQADNTPFNGFSGSGTVQVNSLSIFAPVDGFLLISGSVAVSNDSTSPAFYKLNAKLDGGDLYGQQGVGGEAVVRLDADATHSETDTLAYTVVVAAAAGQHTVAQTLGPVPGFSATFGYSRNNLTALFVPGSRGTLTAAP